MTFLHVVLVILFKVLLTGGLFLRPSWGGSVAIAYAPRAAKELTRDACRNEIDLQSRTKRHRESSSQTWAGKKRRKKHQISDSPTSKARKKHQSKTTWAKRRLENVEKIANNSTKKANKAQLVTQRFEDPLPGTAKRRQQHLKGNLHSERNKIKCKSEIHQKSTCNL